MKNLIIILFCSFMVLGPTSLKNTAWALGNSSINIANSAHQTEEKQISQAPLNMFKEPKSRAPEPSSLVLFGSGLLSMIITLLRRTYHIAKRTMDILTATLAIIILSPLCLLVAILIKLTSKGPIVYSQIRLGKDGTPFNIYKFRTMKVDAEKETGPVWAKAKDNRITAIGNILRKSRIDEIPQFINVLKGDMSVIGPRPERPIFIDQLKTQISDYSKRLCVKPGITGLAQVHHRYDETITDVRKKVKYDILYIKKMCFWTDLRIIFKTFGVVLTGFGAR
jgi:exopolysaccharide biosynthesis polyprenyl glycosylphosphotransferase